MATLKIGDSKMGLSSRNHPHDKGMRWNRKNSNEENLRVALVIFMGYLCCSSQFHVDSISKWENLFLIHPEKNSRKFSRGTQNFSFYNRHRKCSNLCTCQPLATMQVNHFHFPIWTWEQQQQQPTECENCWCSLRARTHTHTHTNNFSRRRVKIPALWWKNACALPTLYPVLALGTFFFSTLLWTLEKSSCVLQSDYFRWIHDSRKKLIRDMKMFDFPFFRLFCGALNSPSLGYCMKPQTGSKHENCCCEGSCGGNYGEEKNYSRLVNVAPLWVRWHANSERFVKYFFVESVFPWIDFFVKFSLSFEFPNWNKCLHLKPKGVQGKKRQFALQCTFKWHWI